MKIMNNYSTQVYKIISLLRLEKESLERSYYQFLLIFFKSRSNQVWNLSHEIVTKFVSKLTFNSSEKSNPLSSFVCNSQKEEMLDICYKIIEIFITINPSLFENNFIPDILSAKFSNHFKYRILKLGLENGFNLNSNGSFILNLQEEDDIQYLTKILDLLIYKNFIFPDEAIFLFKCEDNIKLLLDYSFIPNVITSEGENLLHFIYFGCKNFDILSTVKMLLHEGINPNFQNFIEGNTPLHLHIEHNISNLHPQFFKITKEIIGYGADLNIKNFEGDGILFSLKNLNCYNNDKLLNTRKIIKFLVENGLNINIPDLACEVSLPILKILLECGFNANLENLEGETILHHLFFNILEDYEMIKGVELLQKYGYNFNNINKKGDNILHVFFKHSTFSSQSTLFNLLYEYGAKLTLENNEGKTPLHFVNMEDMFQIFRFAISSKKYKLLDDLLSFFRTEEYKNLLGIFEKYYDNNDKRVVNKIKEYINMRNRSSLVVLNRFICEDVIRYVINKYCYP